MNGQLTEHARLQELVCKSLSVLSIAELEEIVELAKVVGYSETAQIHQNILQKRYEEEIRLLLKDNKHDGSFGKYRRNVDKYFHCYDLFQPWIYERRDLNV